MADPERPAGGADAAPRLRAVRGGGTRRRRAKTAVAVGDFAERLSALERQVEEAFAGGDATPARLVDVGVGADRALAAYADVRRWLAETGAQVAGVRSTADLLLLALHRWWWRVEAVGLERLPARGRVLLVANRAGLLLPWDVLAVSTAVAAAPAVARRPVPLVDDWAAAYPVLGAQLAAIGAAPVSPRRLRALLERDEAVVATLEDAHACARPFAARYRVGPLRRSALLRVAVATGTPIVPVAVVGPEEAQPVLWRLEALGRAVGVPALPVTPTFPWLGVGGLVPLPTKWTVRVGEPLDVAARWRPADARSDDATREVAARVRERLQALVSEGLRRRRSIWFG